MTTDASASALSIDLLLPGSWPTRSDVAAGIRRQADGFIVAGKRLRRVASGAELGLTVDEHDPALAAAVEQASFGSGLSPADLQAIAAHPRAGRLTGPAGTPTGAAALLEFAAAVARGGALAVLVPTAGKAHAAAQWLGLAACGPTAEALYAAFVSLDHGPDGASYISSGMHALGWPDALVPGDLTPERATALLEGFLLLCLQRAPELRPGQAYQESPDAPRFQLVQEYCAHFPPGHPRHNPWGLWRLR